MPFKVPLDGVQIINTNPRLIGMEVELSTWGTVTRHNPFAFRYTIDHDGSVLPSKQEMVINPLVGDGFVQGVLELAEVLDTHKATVNHTCGFHVHIGSLDLTMWDIVNLLTLYCAVEEEIYSLLPENRRENRYCTKFAERFGRPILQTFEEAPSLLRESASIKQVLGMYLYDHNLPTLQSMKEGKHLGITPNLPDEEYWKNYKDLLIAEGLRWRRHAARKYPETDTRALRYAGLNLHSWFYRGTIEFRMWPGTLELDELLCWPLVCAWIVQLSSTLKLSEVQTITSLSHLADRLPPFVGTWLLNKLKG